MHQYMYVHKGPQHCFAIRQAEDQRLLGCTLTPTVGRLRAWRRSTRLALAHGPRPSTALPSSQ